MTSSDPLTALAMSVERLAALVRPLGDDVARAAYPADWTIADVLSHLGSGAVIMRRRIEDGLNGREEAPGDWPREVWGEWDAKSPRDKADDGLAADAELLAYLGSVGDEQRSTVKLAMGPVQFGWDQVVAGRLSEHLLHEWDVTVALDPAATLGDDGVPLVIDNLELIGRYTAKPFGEARTITVATTEPERGFTLTVGPDLVEFTPGPVVDDPVLGMPAEAFVRLVYGRLDPGHTPGGVTGDTAALDQLRRVFPGP